MADGIERDFLKSRLTIRILAADRAWPEDTASRWRLHTQRLDLVRPLHKESDPLGTEEWNRNELCRAKYIDKLDNVLFFAEDIFGVQFCIRGESVCTFDPETAEIEEMSLSLDEWPEMILSDYEVRTGYILAHEWQAANGPLSTRQS